MFLALGLAVARARPFPHGTDLAWSVVAGLAGVVGITRHRGLARRPDGSSPRRPVSWLRIIPVVAGFALEGVPQPAVIVGIVMRLRSSTVPVTG